MESIHKLIDSNMFLMYFLYGQVYFTAGLAIVLKQRSLSKFRLANHLWMLATFGIIHGIAEWGNLFIPLQNSYLPSAGMTMLYKMQDIAFAASFGFLLLFGLYIIEPWLGWRADRVRLAKATTVLWCVGVTIAGVFILPNEGIGETSIRYLLGFPAAMITAVALLAERHSFPEAAHSKARRDLVFTSCLFMLYAVMAGLIVPDQGTWPLRWLNYESIFSVTALPIQFYRAVLGSALAYFIIRSLSVFDVELRQRIDATERQHALLEDRERIARDLHDGVVQSIYAAGLQLGGARRAVGNDPHLVDSLIARTISQLNSVIFELREYIFKLGPAHMLGTDLSSHLEALTDEFSSANPIAAHFWLTGDEVKLPPEVKNNIVLVVRECLSNAARHSGASQLNVSLQYLSDGFELSVEDDGVGFSREKIERRQGHQRGIDNMRSRIASLGGSLRIDRSSMGGARVRIRVGHAAKVPDPEVAVT